MSVSVVILAAGQGTRMKSSTPKVLHKICGEYMLYYAVKTALEISDDVQVVIYYEAQKVKTALTDIFGDKCKFVLQDHINFPGTGGAVMAAKPSNDRVIVTNGDMPLITKASLEKFLNKNEAVVMSAINLQNPSGYGRVVTNGDSVIKIVEEKDASNEQKAIKLVNAGVYSFDKAFLELNLTNLTNNNAQREYYLTDLVEIGVNQNSASWTEVDEAEFKGVNSKVDLACAEEIMLERIRNSWMMSGVSMRLPKTIYIDSAVSFEGECEVESGCVIKGKSKIVNSVIKAGSVVEDAEIINSDCGPMARIRPKSKILNTHIGNFVECKNARLSGVKAGHLSYLGDCEAGEGTNVGAGTITCNYDGIRKHETIIGKNVFIGSDVQLVAPVIVGDNVLIGAGTTVTEDIDSGSLAISRVPQKNISGFFKKFFA
ncbi:MAG: fused N-acetylglucosamine-phosphate uridyltransferase and glucosamine-phosphate [Pseudomonadota bacterium]